MKRLYRLKKGAIIGGVCGGAADYLGVDRNMVRLATVAVFLLTGGVIVGILYIVAMCILPFNEDDVIDG